MSKGVAKPLKKPIAHVVTKVSNFFSANLTFSDKLGGREVFRSADRAFMSMWSCRGAVELGGPKGRRELIGADFEGI